MTDPIHILEYDQILPILLQLTHTFSGKRTVQVLKPSFDAYWINGQFTLIREMLEYMKTAGGLGFEVIEDIREALEGSKIDGSVLGILDILEIRKTLEIFHRNVETLRQEAPIVPHLTKRFQNEFVPMELIKMISQAIKEDGSVYDHASEELKRIRKRKTSIRGDIQGKLGAILNSETMGSVIQEKIITIRDGRFVIPLKSQFKNKVRSEINYITHSYSQTGETAFVEPEDIVRLNNEMVEIDEMELEEIRKILLALTAEIGKFSGDIQKVFDDLGELESIHVRARFALDRNCGFPEIVPDKSLVKLIQARHPLLKADSVPIQVEVGTGFQGLVISGPNAGGKTVALKTVGLLTLMAQSAIPIPADSQSKIGIFDSIFPEIGDEQSISENLSSFSGHILNISSILEKSTDRSLVLIDEIASSTEPKEGEALGREIIKALLEKGTKFIITTHFHGIKEIGYSDSRVRNSFVEFDEEKMIPQYRLNMNGTGSSNALKVARKYGLPEKLLLSAEEYLTAKSTDVEKTLKSMEMERNSLFSKKSILDKRMEEIKILRDKYSALLEEMETRREQAEKKGVSLLKKELDQALNEISALKMELKKKKVSDLKSADQTIATAQKVLKLSEKEQIEKQKKRLQTIKIGQKVFVGTFQKEGFIEELKEDKVKVRIGIVSTIVDRDDLFETEHPIEDFKKRYSIPENLKFLPSVIDLRGELLDDALKNLEKNLDLAMINGVSSVHIIHGKGEGILRKGVWDYLKHLDFVKSYDYAKPEEGGQGKTIVYLK